MDKTIIVVLIVSGTSIVLAIWGLITAKLARRKAIEAEEYGKRTEQIRIKATEAGSKIMEAVADYIIGVESALWHIDMQSGIPKSDTVKVFGPIIQSAVAMRRCALSNAIYLTDEIIKNVELLATQNNIDINLLQDRLDEAHQLHTSLVRQFQKVYLNPVVRIA